jgi:CyaY protein
MEERAYLALADQAFRSVEAALDALDAEDVDCERAGDVLTLTFKTGSRCVLNTQRPTRQLWLAASARAWHFSYSEPTGKWLDDKGRADDLFATLAGIIRAEAGLDVNFGGAVAAR